MRGMLLGFGIDTQARERAGGLKSARWDTAMVWGLTDAISVVFGKEKIGIVVCWKWD